MMNNHQLKELLNELVKQPDESEWVEFKLNFHNPEEIGQRISALSNGACIHNQLFGYLIFGIEDQNYSIASRIIRDALEDGAVKEDDPNSKSRKYASYIPFWA